MEKHQVLKGQSSQPWSSEVLRDFLRDTEAYGRDDLVFCSDDLEAMWLDFKKEFEVIEAGGGVVRNNAGETLFIFRFGKWDLPKGKIDPGESVAKAALREVREECGFHSVQIERPLPSTYHLYQEKGTEVLKITHWFEMKSEDKKLQPQLEEGITELRWFGSDDLRKPLGNTYPNITLLMGSI